MSEQEILALASIVKETSELLWHIAMLKAYGEALQHVAWTFIFVVSLIGTSFGSLRAFWAAKKNNNEDWLIGGWILAVGAVLSLVAIGGFLGGAIIRLVAPEYFALRTLMGLV